MRHLEAVQAAEETVTVVENRVQALRLWPHCDDKRAVRRGHAHGLLRYRCCGCGKTFNTLTRTPLARPRHRDRWPGQTQALIDGMCPARSSPSRAGATCDSDRTASSGAPACARRRASIQCGDCANRLSILLSDAVIHEHLAGDHAHRPPSARR